MIDKDNTDSFTKQTSLHYCALMGHTAVMHRLLDFGGPDFCTVKDDEGNTALHCLANNVMSGRKELSHMFALLIKECPAAAKELNEKSKTPLDIVEERM